ncbi:MAG: YkgJ family cysteine cluster protein [Thermoplasmatota archaeon]
METGELRGLRYRCLEGCGFCCTFTPEVAHDELARLRQAFPKLPVARGEAGGLHLAFQGGCGACTLLSRRACTAYGLRPAHCRYFPFHVYFGRRTEAYVNRTCRGVEPDPVGDLMAEFQAQVLAVAKPHAIAEHERQARKVHNQFYANAQAAGLWGDVDAAAARALAEPNLWKDAASEEAWAAALEPFAQEEVVARPFHLAADLRWLTFEARGGRTLQPLRMEEDGSLAAEGPAFEVEPPALQPATLAQLHAVLSRMAGRDHFAGTVFDAVDASDYTVPVEVAAAQRVREMAADLLVRCAILLRLGVPEAELAAEAERFYDAAFLDAPTIGGWL